MKKKIVYTITRMIIGGAQETAKLTAEHFAREGHDVLLVTGVEAGREGQYTVNAPVEPLPALVRNIAPLKDARALFQLVRLLRRARPAVVHSRTAKARFLTGLAARLARCRPVIQSVEGWSFNNQIDSRHGLYVLLEKLAAPLYDWNIMVSQMDLDEGLRRGIIRREKASIIRSGVDLDRMRHFDAAAVATLRETLAPAGETVVTLIGRLSMPKTPDIFVRAAAITLTTHPRTRFVLVGDGDKRELVESLLRELGIEKNVTLLGLRRDIAELAQASDIIVHSSTHEGLPKTVLEAMAAERAVIATNVGGVSEIVRDGDTGLLVEPLRVEELATAMTRLIGDRTLRESLVASASKAVVPFTIEQTLVETEALYDRLLAERNRR